jgi:hypothetical protein
MRTTVRMKPVIQQRPQFDRSNSVRQSDGRLELWIDPGNGTPYSVDLSELMYGGRRQELPARLRRGWTGDFSGRPVFAHEFGEMLRWTRPGPETCRNWRHAMRVFFRFLDEQQEATGRVVGRIADVSDGDGPLFRTRCDCSTSGASVYRSLKTVVDRMRDLDSLPPLFWPARRRDTPCVQEAVDTLGMRRLFNALKAEGREIKNMFREGERLADAGVDPRGARHDEGFQKAGWQIRENHAWLVRELTRGRIPDRAELLASRAHGLIKSNNAATQKHHGPTYLVPGMTERGREGMVGKLRWFHPSYHDTGIFFWLFLIGTGWNLSTALAIDVSEEARWVDDHPHGTNFRVLHAFKDRAARHQFTVSMAEPEWHPYQIVRFMMERTKVLRATLRHRLEQALLKQSESPTAAVAQRIGELKAGLRSPWLYHVINKTGAIGTFHHSDSAALNELARAVSAKHELSDSHPSLVQVTTAIARDAWIGYAYVKSGYHVLLTKLASQHATARTLKHYLNRRAYREHSEGQIRRWQNAAFAEIAERRPLDPTRLWLLVQNGTISREQERRLLDIRQRTRLGMGCLDPTHPPKEVAPDHTEGALCRVQRCTGCRRGVVFEESLGPLARAHAELQFIQRQIPLASWAGSSFEDELISIEKTLECFDRAKVEAETNKWLERLNRGEVIPHDTYPSY